MVEYATVLYAVIGSLLYSLSFYAKNNTKHNESISLSKLGATLVVGGVVGVFGLLIAPQEFTQSDFQTQMVAYSGATAIVEALIKAAYGRVNNE